MHRFWFTLSLICFAAAMCCAQVFPIQSQVSLVPPYSGNLSDYTFPGSQRISVSLTCNDITISNYRVKLRVTIEGLGITVRSKPNLAVQPFIVDGGSALVLYGDDLAQYLDPRNLDFIGYSRTEYQRTGKLPEGVYRFSVEVLDSNRGIVVSNKGFATAWIMWNDVPILNFPANNGKVRIVDPTNIPFSWTARHTGSPNSAFSTEYVFRLIEIWSSNRNPNDAFLTQTPLYEVVTSQSQIVYGPGEPLLIPGRRYCWQVLARDTEGRDLFKNNGKSEVFVFQFGDAIEMPQNVRKETANATTISIRWESSSNGEIPEQFRIRYRSEGGSTWYEDVTTQYWHTLTGLQNNKAYDIQVRSESGRQVSDYTFNQRHSTTSPVADPNYQCGNPFNIQPPAMTTPLQHMNPGDIFKAADFDVFVTEVVKSPTPGVFSGKGYAKFHMMNRANIEGIFSGTFNNEFQMVTGSFKTTYESGSKMAHLAEEMKKIGEKPPVLDSAIQKLESTLITITGVIDTAYFNSDGKIEIIDQEGNVTVHESKTSSGSQTVVITDSKGNIYEVGRNPTGNDSTSMQKPLNPANPKQIDVANLDEFEKLVKEVIDSLYLIRVGRRDSIIQIQARDQKSLNEKVGVINSLEASVEDNEPTIVQEINLSEVLENIELLDSLVEMSVVKITSIENDLAKLNGYLDQIKSMSSEVKKSDQFETIVAIVEKKKRIARYITDKIKQ